MQSKQRSLTLLLITLTLLLALVPQPASAAGYGVVVNGRAVPDTLAEMRSGQIMVAVRPLVEAMGGYVSWNGAAKMTTIYYRGTEMALWVGNSLGFQDGARVWATVAPYLKDGRMMVPGWWLGVRLGATVYYANNTLYVNTGASGASAPSNPAPRPNHVLANPRYVFPFPAGASYQPYNDSMGDPRWWQGQQFPHEGIDILAPKGTPVVAVTSGTIVRYGWNTLGGYRLTIQVDDAPAYKLYYAHLDRYAPGLYEGAHVKAGQLLGYVGSTGEGPERTEGKFVPHLHFGIYDANWNAINPYPLLKYWESNKAALQ